MTMIIIQLIGVFIAALMGSTILSRTYAKQDIPAANFIYFAIGVTMMLSKFFMK